MAQSYQAAFVQTGEVIDYTPVVAVHAGDVYQHGSLIGVACESIAANTLGHLAIKGIFQVVKINEQVTIGAKMYWNSAGTPDWGGAGATGACCKTAGSLPFLGWALEASDGTEEEIKILLAGTIATVSSQHEFLSPVVADVGNAGIFTAALTSGGGMCMMTSAAAETRVLYDPSGVGIVMGFCHSVDGGSITMTATTAGAGASSLNDTGSATPNVALFTHAGETLVLISVQSAATTYKWRVFGNDGVALSSV